jgi:ribosomal protein S14
MSIWAVIAGVVVALVLVQVAVYRYLWSRRESLVEAESSNGGRAGEDGRPRERREPLDPTTSGWVAPNRGEHAEEPTGGPRRCPQCGAENEPESAFTFCRHCASRLA